MDVAAIVEQLGWFVFPVAPGSKVPHKNFQWRQMSSNDPGQILDWRMQFPQSNWAVDCGKSGLFVVDIDPGAENIPPLPETFTVRTPRGGLHYYYAGSGKTTASQIGKHIDTRGEGGYVLLPGSTVNGSGYSVELRIPIAKMPDTYKLIDAPQSTPASRQACEDLDTDAAIAAAVNYLRYEAPEAIEGQAGDMTTLQVAMRVKDIGISQSKVVELLWHEWNFTKAKPSWDHVDLTRKVANAFSYGKNPVGSAAPSTMFDLVQPTPPSSIPGLMAASQVDIRKIPPREWVIQDRYIKRRITVTIAPGSVGKSTFTMSEAMAVAVGKPLAGMPVKIQCPTLVINLEDPLEELQLQVAALRKFHDLKRTDLKQFYIKSTYGETFNLLTQVNGVPTLNNLLLNSLIHTIKTLGIGLVIFDPLVKLHSIQENDNMGMDKLMIALSHVADLANCAIGVAHHTNKPTNGLTESDKGANAGRGASSIINAARVSHLLGIMSKKAAKLYGIEEHQRKWFVKIEQVKANLSPPTDRDQWYRRRSIELINGDNVGILDPVVLEPIQNDPLTVYTEPLFSVVAQAGGTITINKATNDMVAMGIRGPRGGVSAFTIGKALRELFALGNGRIMDSQNHRMLEFFDAKKPQQIKLVAWSGADEHTT